MDSSLFEWLGWVQSSEFRVPGSEFRVSEPQLLCYRRAFRDAERPIQSMTFSNGNPEPGTRNPRPETRNPEPGTRNSKPGTRKLLPLRNHLAG